MYSFRRNTKQKCDIYKKQWLKYRKNHKIIHLKATFLNGLNFLIALFEEYKNYFSVACARSVLSTLIKPINGTEFGKQILVKKFMKILYDLILCLPKYNYAWNIKDLFNYYRNSKANEELELKSITIKTVKLL